MTYNPGGDMTVVPCGCECEGCRRGDHCFNPDLDSPYYCSARGRGRCPNQGMMCNCTGACLRPAPTPLTTSGTTASGGSGGSGRSDISERMDEFMAAAPLDVEVQTQVQQRLSNVQVAPYPHELEELVTKLNHRPRWGVTIGYVDRGQGSQGLTVSVYITEPDAYHSDRDRSVVHYFPVPPAAYDLRSWQRWLFDRLGEVDTHERMEHFTIDGEKPYAPSHGPGSDPYLVREVGTELDVKTAFTGKVNET